MRQCRPVGATPPAAPGVCQPRQHSGDEVSEGNDHQHPLGVPGDQAKITAISVKRRAGWRSPEVTSLALQKRQLLTMRKPVKSSSRSQTSAIQGSYDGRSVEEMDDGGDDTCAGRDGHADEELVSRLAGVARLRIDADIEARQTAGPADEKEETDEDAGVQHVFAQVGMDREGQHAEAPDVGEQAGRDAEGDDVGERVQLLAKVAGGVGDARDDSRPRRPEGPRPRWPARRGRSKPARPPNPVCSASWRSSRGQCCPR